jgi:hypothetical protein
MVLRRIFDPKRGEVTGEWRKLHNEELKDLYFLKYFSTVKIKKNRLGEMRDAYRVLVGKPKGKRPLGRLRLRWEDNIKMNLQEFGCGSMDWIDLDQDRGLMVGAFECGKKNLGFHRMRGIYIQGDS